MSSELLSQLRFDVSGKMPLITEFISKLEENDKINAVYLTGSYHPRRNTVISPDSFVDITVCVKFHEHIQDIRNIIADIEHATLCPDDLSDDLKDDLSDDLKKESSAIIVDFKGTRFAIKVGMKIWTSVIIGKATHIYNDQIDRLSRRDKHSDLIVLMKSWNKKNNFDLESYEIEEMVVMTCPFKTDTTLFLLIIKVIENMIRKISSQNIKDELVLAREYLMSGINLDNIEQDRIMDDLFLPVRSSKTKFAGKKR